MTQLAIVILGGLAIYLLASKRARVRRWGYVSGLASEPFWIHASVTTEQWGVVLLAVWWGWFYFRGAVNNWHAG